MANIMIGGIIELKKCEIDHLGQRRLQAALRENSTLQKLSVKSTQLTNTVVDAMCSFVCENQTMTSIVLEANLSDASLSRILQCLCFNTTLKVLEIGPFVPSGSFVDAFCHFVHYNNTMTHLYCRLYLESIFARLLKTIAFKEEHLDLLMNTLGVSTPIRSIEAIKKGPDPCLKVIRSGVRQTSYYFYLENEHGRLELLEPQPYQIAKQAQLERRRRSEPLSEALNAVLNRNRVCLVEQMIPDRVYDHLRQDNSLSLREVEDITFNRPRYQQVQKLLDCLQRKSRQDYENFKKALIETEQEHLEEVLTAAERNAGIYEKTIQEVLSEA